MSDIVSLVERSAPDPGWRLKELDRCLQRNRSNRLRYFDAKGKSVEVSYPQIREEAWKLIAMFEEAGFPLGKGKRCAVAAVPSYEWVLAAVACILTGTELVAVPETLQEGELEDTLTELGIDFCICDPQIRKLAPFHSLPGLETDGIRERCEQRELATNVYVPCFSVVAFTSGSRATSKLKAFRLQAGATELFISVFVREFGLNESDDWLVCHPFSHIVHLEYVLGGLCAGYNVTLATPMQLVLKGRELCPAVVVTVPSVYQHLLRVIHARLPTRGIRAALIRLLHRRPSYRFSRPLAKWVRPWLLREVESVIGEHLKVMIIGAAPSSESMKRELVSLGVPVYEGYGLSETNMVACNVPGHERPETVGPVWPGVSVRVTDTGGVQVRLQAPRTQSYLNVGKHENMSTFLEGGWIDTGDVGRLDGEYLTITGREKDIIVTDRGKNINPASIETLLQGITGIQNALVFGDNRPFLVALLNCAGDVVLNEEEVRMRIEELNRCLPSHERIQSFLLLEDELNEGNGLMTRSGKPRRRVIEERYADALEELYGREAAV